MWRRGGGARPDLSRAGTAARPRVSQRAEQAAPPCPPGAVAPPPLCHTPRGRPRPPCTARASGAVAPRMHTPCHFGLSHPLLCRPAFGPVAPRRGSESKTTRLFARPKPDGFWFATSRYSLNVYLAKFLDGRAVKILCK